MRLKLYECYRNQNSKSEARISKWFDLPFDKPFDQLTVLSKVEGLTVLSYTEGLTILRDVEGQYQMTEIQMTKMRFSVFKVF